MKKNPKIVLFVYLLILLLSCVISFVVSKNRASDFLRESYYALKTMECLYATGKEHSEPKDVWAFWPKSQVAIENQTVCSNSTSFLLNFISVLNNKFGYTKEWCNEFKDNNLSKDGCKWSILVNASSEQPECVPVLVSQNLNLFLVARFLTSDELAQRQAIKIDRGFIFFRSMKYHLFAGGCDNRANKWSITCEDRAKLPYVATYLTPTGMITITFGQNRDMNDEKGGRVMGHGTN